jgi:hypothetical protein
MRAHARADCLAGVCQEQRPDASRRLLHRKTAHMRGSLTARRHVTAGLLAATLLFAACGGGGDGGDASGDALPRVDLVGADVLPTSEFDANQRPNVVVNDINTGPDVNFRILIPQEKPILLWMWAPQ